jgi:hypothetical protein
MLNLVVCKVTARLERVKATQTRSTVNGVLGKIFGSKRDEMSVGDKLHSEELRVFPAKYY